MNKESSKYGINRKLGVDENRIKILFVCHGNILYCSKIQHYTYL